MVNDAGVTACGGAGSAERGSEEVNAGGTLSDRVGVGATCETGAKSSGRAGEVAEAAGCTFSCVPSEMKVGSGLLGAAGITGGGGGGGVNAAGTTGAAGGGATGATNATGAAGATGIDTFCTGAAFTGVSGITTGAAAEITGAVWITGVAAGPSDGK